MEHRGRNGSAWLRERKEVSRRNADASEGVKGVCVAPGKRRLLASSEGVSGGAGRDLGEGVEKRVALGTAFVAPRGSECGSVWLHIQLFTD